MQNLRCIKMILKQEKNVDQETATAAKVML